jgi:hypothetical protein
MRTRILVAWLGCLAASCGSVAAPDCEMLGEARTREFACGVCMRGTLSEICGPGRLWRPIDTGPACDDPQDRDGDGFSNFECIIGMPLDCNDDDPMIFPGAVGNEVCIQGEEEPCTTSCDTPSVQRCAADCTWGACIECVPGSAYPCTTSCGTDGTGECTAGCVPPDPADCTPPPEACNAADDDCDGATDEDFPCRSGESGQPCLTTCGSTGTGTCTADCGYPPPDQCTVPPETCNGQDDNCDTVCDEGFGECCERTSRDCTTGTGAPGSQLCEASCRWGACDTDTEVCNGLDDDGDTRPDNGFDCVQGAAGIPCTTTCGSANAGTCTTDCRVPAGSACPPPSEACNGADDDCDTRPDNGFACVRGASQTQNCGNCNTGTQAATCGTACTWGEWGTCSGGGTCAPGATLACNVGSCGAIGTQTCSASCTWGGCVAPAEVCNGRDDDCDGSTDEGYTCTAGATRACTGSCFGTQTCNTSCSGWSTCSGPATPYIVVYDGRDGSATGTLTLSSMSCYNLSAVPGNFEDDVGWFDLVAGPNTYVRFNDDSCGEDLELQCIYRGNGCSQRFDLLSTGVCGSSGTNWSCRNRRDSENTLHEGASSVQLVTCQTCYVTTSPGSPCG